jgi:hypothetical protein
MDLYLRKSDDGQLGPEIYRVILKDDGDEVEIGSISVKHSASAAYYWSWAIACGSSRPPGGGSRLMRQT